MYLEITFFCICTYTYIYIFFFWGGVGVLNKVGVLNWDPHMVDALLTQGNKGSFILDVFGPAPEKKGINTFGSMLIWLSWQTNRPASGTTWPNRGSRLAWPEPCQCPGANCSQRWSLCAALHLRRFQGKKIRTKAISETLAEQGHLVFQGFPRQADIRQGSLRGCCGLPLCFCFDLPLRSSCQRHKEKRTKYVSTPALRWSSWRRAGTLIQALQLLSHHAERIWDWHLGCQNLLRRCGCFNCPEGVARVDASLHVDRHGTLKRLVFFDVQAATIPCRGRVIRGIPVSHTSSCHARFDLRPARWQAWSMEWAGWKRRIIHDFDFWRMGEFEISRSQGTKSNHVLSSAWLSTTLSSSWASRCASSPQWWQLRTQPNFHR